MDTLTIVSEAWNSPAHMSEIGMFAAGQFAKPENTGETVTFLVQYPTRDDGSAGGVDRVTVNRSGVVVAAEAG